MAKYSDIDRAKQLLAAKTKLDAWRDLEQAEKATLYQSQTAITGNKRNAVGKVEGFIIPFGYDPSKNIWLRVYFVGPSTGTLTPRQEAAATLITHASEIVYGGTAGTGVFGTLTKPTELASSITAYTGKNDAGKLARMTLRKKGARLENRIASRVTGLLYTYTKSDSVSCAFGQKVTGTTEQSFASAMGDLKIAAKAKDSEYTVSFRAQGVISIEVVGA